MPTLIRWNARVCAAWINTVVCTLQCLLGFASAAHAQCGVGWALAAGDGPGAYEICYDESRARTVLFGGTTTYEWDGVAWETVAISGPPERGAGALVYDPIGARCLLFGGYSSAGARKDLWSWNGIAWTQLSAGPESVSGRGDFAMAFDRDRNRLVIHGGWPARGGLLTDTIEWNPTNNSWQIWETSPIGPRYAHRMAYDEARGEIILHGGYYFTNKSDTWRWNGSTWSLASTSGPARYVFGMTYDSGRSQLVLHGGTTCCGEVEYTQTYVWNGSAWSQCAMQGPARGYMNIAYDRAREVIVLPGGMGPTPAGRAYVPETWELAMARRVPTDYPTIQAAVDASVDGDTVLVDPGTYVESVNLRGKAITVRSLVVGGASVLAPQDARSFVAVSGEPSAMRVIGFRIGRADSWGGGAATTSSSVVFENCTFEGCRNHTGGGALVSGGSPSFIRCHFTDCIVDGAGGGLFGGGGAIRSVGGSVTIDYCAFDNCCGAQGRIMMQEGGGSSVMRHSTLRGIEGIAWAWIYNEGSSFTIEDSVFDSMEGAALFGWSPYTVRRCTFRNITGYSVMDMRFGEQIVDSCRFEQCHVVYMFAVTYSGTYALGNSTFCDCSTPTFQAGWSDLGGNNFNASCGTNLVVPTDYPTIQAAINAVQAGARRVVEVLAGTYSESFALNGKDVIVRGAANNATILDGTGLTISIAKFTGGEPATAGVEDLVFRNGTVGSRFTPTSTFTIGGAIYANNTAAHISNCRFENCRADFGGAIYQYVGALAWANCVFTNNIGNVDGGAVLVYNCTGTVRDSSFTGNRCGMNGPGSGSAFKAVGSNGDGESIVLDACVMTGNIASDSGSAIEFYEHVKYHPGVLTILNSSITGNTSGEPISAGGAGLRVLGRMQSCVVGAGTTICDNDPINAAGPYFIEGGAQVCDCMADLTGDGQVNSADLGMLLSSWGITLPSGVGDVDHNGVVNAPDLAALLSHWGVCD
jgi:hypothetical protein